jgi:hypothetical protein
MTGPTSARLGSTPDPESETWSSYTDPSDLPFSGRRVAGKLHRSRATLPPAAAVVFVAVLAAHTAAKAPGRARSAELIQTVVKQGRQELALPGACVAVMRGSTLVLATGDGLADREEGAPATASA